MIELVRKPPPPPHPPRKIRNIKYHKKYPSNFTPGGRELFLICNCCICSLKSIFVICFYTTISILSKSCLDRVNDFKCLQILNKSKWKKNCFIVHYSLKNSNLLKNTHESNTKLPKIEFITQPSIRQTNSKKSSGNFFFGGGGGIRA